MRQGRSQGVRSTFLTKKSSEMGNFKLEFPNFSLISGKKSRFLEFASPRGKKSNFMPLQANPDYGPVRDKKKLRKITTVWFAFKTDRQETTDIDNYFNYQTTTQSDIT